MSGPLAVGTGLQRSPGGVGVRPDPIGPGRPSVHGKFLRVGDERLFVRGVTYGTFRPGQDDLELPPRDVARDDLSAMAAHGINAVRTYTSVPRWFLDLAAESGLRVLIGIPAERYIGLLGEPGGVAEIERVVREAVRPAAGHPGVLAWSVGNELPASLVRWFGRRSVERFLRRLADIVRQEDPGGLVTYASYPSTEYLDLPFLDFLAFNVYLEDPERLRAYLARLQTLAGERPLLMTEVGLDSLRNGEAQQAQAISDQLRVVFESGCAGSFVYSWTDEWYRSGEDVEDWAFGLTRRDRSPKLALPAVRRCYEAVPFPGETSWPKISVVVCSYNGARTLGECLEGLQGLDYPDFEVLVVDDGSTDGTAELACEAGFPVFSKGHHGLSHARNLGLHAATGEIVAYLDDDATPDPHWLRYLALAFREPGQAAAGGPNLPFPGDGPVAACIANTPGSPIHVLLTDEEAEHVPGCNMAFRRERLLELGGFDERFRIAGDDVDICWRVRDRGWTIGFHAAAVVWHHRRGSVRAFWRQQRNYGAAEADLEAKYPERYNTVGHASWSGRVYGAAPLPLLRGAPRVYHGVWGRAPFQSLYEPRSGTLALLPLCPEWYLLTLGLGALSALGLVRSPLLFAFPFFLLALGTSVLQALQGALRCSFDEPRRAVRIRLRALTAFLHLMQPLARLSGRVRAGLTPWRCRRQGFALPRPRVLTHWTERGRPLEGWLSAIEGDLRGQGLAVVRGGDFARWDLAARCGPLASVRLLLGLEEHGQGRQFVRFRVWPRFPSKVLVLAGLGGVTAAAALSGGERVLAGAIALLVGLLVLRATLDAGSVQRCLLSQLARLWNEGAGAAAGGDSRGED